MKYLISISALLILTFAASAQESLLQRLAQIEQNNANIANRLSALENKVDLLASKIDSHLAAIKTKQVTNGNGSVTQEAGQWVCDPMGVCRWVPSAMQSAAQTTPSGYEWQWIQGQAMMVPVGWCSCPTCQAGYGIGRYTGYSYSSSYSCASGAYAEAGAGSGKCKLFSKFRARRMARLAARG